MKLEKKYCFFSSFPKKHREVILYRQAKSLIDDGWTVYCVVSSNAPDEVDRGVHYISSGYEGRSILQRFFVAPRKIFNRLKEVDADVYHTVDIGQLPNCRKLKRMGKGVLFEMQEDHPYSLEWKSTLPKWILKPVIWGMSKWMGKILRKLDVVTALSYDTANYLKEWGCSTENVHLIGNFPEVRKDYVLTKEDYMSREDRMLYFGIIYSYSRQEVILKALNNIPGLKYLVAGVFMGNERQTYRPKIMGDPIWKERVEFIEGFKHDELEGFVKRSTMSNVVRDFSIYPREKSGSFGIIKIFESMENALPIICPDMPLYREMMKKYKCGILANPNDPEDIENAIRYLVEHKEEAWQMGQEGRRAVIEKYSWDALSVKYLKTVNALVK